MGEKKHKRRDIAERERLAAQMNVVDLRAELEKQTGLVRALTQRLDAMWNALGRPIGDGTIGRMQPMFDRIAELTNAEQRALHLAPQVDWLKSALAIAQRRAGIDILDALPGGEMVGNGQGPARADGCHCVPDDGEPACPVHGLDAPTTVGEDGVSRFSDGSSAE